MRLSGHFFSKESKIFLFERNMKEIKEPYRSQLIEAVDHCCDGQQLKCDQAKKLVFYCLEQIDRIGQLSCEIQCLRSLYPCDTYSIVLIVPSPGAFVNLNKSLFRSLTNDIQVIVARKKYRLFDDDRRYNRQRIGVINHLDVIYVFLPPHKIVELCIEQFGEIGWSYRTSLSLPELERGRQLRNDLNIPEKAKIVTLHVRESGYLPNRNFYNYRDASIKNYIAAIHYLLDNGVYVIRLGDKSMQPLDIESPLFIDAPFYPEYTDFFDTYFISQSWFFIGMQSGPCSVAHIFNIPMLFTNTLFCYGLSGYDKGLMIPKKYYSKILSRNLTYEEILRSPVLNYNHSQQFTLSHIDLVENNSSEILDAVREMISRLKGEYKGEQFIEDEIATIKNTTNAYSMRHDVKGGYEIKRIGYVQLSHDYIKKNTDFLGHRWCESYTSISHDLFTDGGPAGGDALGICSNDVSEKIFSQAVLNNIFEISVGKRVAIWGAGRYSKELLTTRLGGLNLRYIFDNDKSKNNTYFEWLPVISLPIAPDDVKNLVDVIIVVSQTYGNAISEGIAYLDRYDVKIINIFEEGYVAK